MDRERSSVVLSPITPDSTPLEFPLLWVYLDKSRLHDQKQIFSAVERPHKGICGYSNPHNALKAPGEMLNIVWIFFVPARMPTLKSTTVRSSQKKKLRTFFRNGTDCMSE
jgi:hypothetical protein